MGLAMKLYKALLLEGVDSQRVSTPRCGFCQQDVDGGASAGGIEEPARALRLVKAILCAYLPTSTFGRTMGRFAFADCRAHVQTLPNIDEYRFGPCHWCDLEQNCN